MRKLLFVAIATCAVLSACKKKSSGGGSASPSPSASASPSPSASSLNRSDLNATCNRIGDGTSSAQCGVKGEWKHMAKTISVVYTLPADLFTRAGKPNNPKTFIDEIYRRMDAVGLCAVFDGGTLLVRDETGLSENYTLYNDRGTLGVFVEAYDSCKPAKKYAKWDEQNMLHPEPYCNLAPSYWNEGTDTCQSWKDGAQSRFMGDVNKAIDDLLAEERANPTGLIDFTDSNSGNTFKIHAGGSWAEYHATYLERVAGILRSKGFCVLRDFGTQGGITVKKDNNTSSEYFALIQSNGYMRRFYHSSCYPAGF